MADVPNGANAPAPVSAAPGSQTSGVSAAATENKAAENTDYVSKEDFAELKRSLDWATGEIRRFKAAKPDATPPPQSTEKALNERVSELEKERADSAAEKVEIALSKALQTHGVTSDNEDVLKDHLTKRHKISYDRDTKQVLYQDDLGQAKPVAELVSAFMKSKGKSYVPAPAVAGVPRTNGAVAPGQAKSFSEMSQTERLELKAKDKKAYFAALQAEQNSSR